VELSIVTYLKPHTHHRSQACLYVNIPHKRVPCGVQSWNSHTSTRYF